MGFIPFSPEVHREVVPHPKVPQISDTKPQIKC